MYRHFPTRQDLIVAVYAGEMAALCELGPQLLLAEAVRAGAVHADVTV